MHTPLQPEAVQPIPPLFKVAGFLEGILMKRRKRVENSERNKLHVTKHDLERATADGLYAKRLQERGVNPFKLFLELNEIAEKTHRVGTNKREQ
jgi:hypothetical protein